MNNSVEPIISSRRIKDHDEDFLYFLYASGRTEELAPLLWNNTQKESFLKSQYGARKQHYQSHYHNSIHQIITLDSYDVGMIHYCEKEDEIRLIDIAVMPEFQNKGVGTTLLKELINFAKKWKKPLRLSVLKYNPKALRLYERLGFSVISEDAMYKMMELL